MKRSHAVKIGHDWHRYEGFGGKLTPVPAVIALVHYVDGRNEVWGLDDADKAVKSFHSFLADLQQRGVRGTAVYYGMGIPYPDGFESYLEERE